MSYQSVENIPNRNDSDTVWLNWHKDLRSALGSKKANDIFSRAWSSQDASDSDANTSVLREKMENAGIDISGGVIGGSLDFGRQVTGYLGDVFTTAKWVSLIVGGVVVVSVGGLLLQIAFKPSVRKEAVNIGATVATRGMNKM